MSLDSRSESETEEGYILSEQTYDFDGNTFERKSIFDKQGLVAGIEYEDTGLGYNPEEVEAYVRNKIGKFREISSQDFRKIRNTILEKEDSEKTNEIGKLEGTESAQTFQKA